ncbi:MAG: DUF1015 family protein [Defluviitaleaceae bacterium]|nr:DUF1015 family protein [Defluviitaleaceae bacterium]
MSVTIKPFCALRPKPEMAKDVAALPYDVMNTEEAKTEAANKPYSFLHVDKAEIDCPKGTDLYSPVVYTKAKENLQKLADNVLIKDEKPMLYIYQLTANGCTQTGLGACVSVAEYEQGVIKRHEFTRPDKEQDRINHMLACSAHTGPIFMAYRDSADSTSPRALMSEWIATNKPTYDFIADDGVKHALWVIEDDMVQEKLIKAFEDVPCIYIADGHHRNEAARKAANANSPESLFYLAVIFPHDELAIMDYNRVVKDLNGLDKSEFLSAVKKIAMVQKSPAPVKPTCKNEVGMYMSGQWYQLAIDKGETTDITGQLDVSILQNKILSPILGIQDPKADARIDFVGGIRGTEELERRVNSGEMAVAFALYPTSMEELMAVADADQIMPPKSTWFEPKLRSGLLVHVF